MKPHMIAFGGAAQDYSAGLVTVPFVNDPVIRASSNVLQLTDDWKILYGWAGGVGHTRLRLNSASLRIRGYPNLVPFQATHLAGDNPPMLDFTENPLPLRAGENVSLQATNAGAQAFVAALQLYRGDPNYNVNGSALRWVRFTSSPTSVAYAWSSEYNITLDDDMEAGNYDVFGFHIFEADAILGRLVFKDQVERPGCIAGQAATDRFWPKLPGVIGKLGTFHTITPPMLQVMHVAAAAQSIVGYLLIGKAVG